MKWFLIYTAVLFGLWHVIDLNAGTVLESVVAPLAFALVLIAFLVWLSVKVGGSRSSSTGGLRKAVLHNTIKRLVNRGLPPSRNCPILTPSG